MSTEEQLPTEAEIEEIQSSNTPLERLKQLAQSNLILARLLAKNPSTSAQLLEYLSNMEDEEVIQGVAGNGNTPPDILLNLGDQCPSVVINNPIFKWLSLENPNLFNQIAPDSLISLLKVPEFPRDYIFLVLNNERYEEILRAGLIEIWNQWREENKQIKINLEDANLQRTNLKRTNLEDANLEGAHLENAHLENAHLKATYLQKAHLEGANLEDTNLEDANLKGANLSRANLSRANLSRANLSEANLSEANLLETNLSEANLSRANLSEANLSRANLSRANLSRANLSEANLSEANLLGANLSEASLLRAKYLSRANLSRANLSRTNLLGANLSEANLLGANLSEANLLGANLSEANLLGANLSRANLLGANLLGANLSKTIIIFLLKRITFDHHELKNYAFKTLENMGLTSKIKTLTEQFKKELFEEEIIELIDIILESFSPDKKNSVLRTVRDITSWSLKETKEFIESAPNKLFSVSSKIEADNYQEILENSGAVVKLIVLKWLSLENPNLFNQIAPDSLISLLKVPEFPVDDIFLLLNNERYEEILRAGLIEIWNQWREENKEIKINLSYANLEKTNLKRTNLESAILQRANLKDANLQGANLEGADLQSAHLEGAHLEGAHLEGAHLEGANLSGVNLSGVNLSEANLSGANLSGVNLLGANLSGVNLLGANLSGANLSGAKYLSRANLAGANLSKVNLSKVNLSKVNLSKVNLSEADLSGANLSGTNLLSTNLSGTNLSGTNLANTIIISLLKAILSSHRDIKNHAFKTLETMGLASQITTLTEQLEKDLLKETPIDLTSLIYNKKNYF